MIIIIMMFPKDVSVSDRKGKEVEGLYLKKCPNMACVCVCTSIHCQGFICLD